MDTTIQAADFGASTYSGTQDISPQESRSARIRRELEAEIAATRTEQEGIARERATLREDRYWAEKVEPFTVAGAPDLSFLAEQDITMGPAGQGADLRANVMEERIADVLRYVGAERQRTAVSRATLATEMGAANIVGAARWRVEAEAAAKTRETAEWETGYGEQKKLRAVEIANRYGMPIEEALKVDVYMGDWFGGERAYQFGQGGPGWAPAGAKNPWEGMALTSQREPVPEMGKPIPAGAGGGKAKTAMIGGMEPVKSIMVGGRKIYFMPAKAWKPGTYTETTPEGETVTFTREPGYLVDKETGRKLTEEEILASNERGSSQPFWHENQQRIFRETAVSQALPATLPVGLAGLGASQWLQEAYPGPKEGIGSAFLQGAWGAWAGLPALAMAVPGAELAGRQVGAGGDFIKPLAAAVAVMLLDTGVGAITEPERTAGGIASMIAVPWVAGKILQAGSPAIESERFSSGVRSTGIGIRTKSGGVSEFYNIYTRTSLPAEVPEVIQDVGITFKTAPELAGIQRNTFLRTPTYPAEVIGDFGAEGTGAYGANLVTNALKGTPDAVRIGEGRNLAKLTAKTPYRAPEMAKAYEGVLERKGYPYPKKGAEFLVGLMDKEGAAAYGSTTTEAYGRTVGEPGNIKLSGDIDLHAGNQAGLATKTTAGWNKIAGFKWAVAEDTAISVVSSGEKVLEVPRPNAPLPGEPPAPSKPPEGPGSRGILSRLTRPDYFGWGMESEPHVRGADVREVISLSEQVNRKLSGGTYQVFKEPQVYPSDFGDIEGRVMPEHPGRVKDVGGHYAGRQAQAALFESTGRVVRATEIRMGAERWLEGGYGQEGAENVRAAYQEQKMAMGGVEEKSLLYQGTGPRQGSPAVQQALSGGAILRAGQQGPGGEPPSTAREPSGFRAGAEPSLARSVERSTSRSIARSSPLSPSPSPTSPSPSRTPSPSLSRVVSSISRPPSSISSRLSPSPSPGSSLSRSLGSSISRPPSSISSRLSPSPSSSLSRSSRSPGSSISRSSISRGSSLSRGATSTNRFIPILPGVPKMARQQPPGRLVGYGEVVHPIVTGRYFLGLEGRKALPPVRQWHLTRAEGRAAPGPAMAVARSRASSGMVKVGGHPKFTEAMTFGKVYKRSFWKKLPRI